MTMRNRIVDGVLVILFGFVVSLAFPSQMTQAASSTAEVTVHGTLPDTGFDLPTGKLPNTAGIPEGQRLQQHRLPATGEDTSSSALVDLGFVLMILCFGGWHLLHVGGKVG